MNEKHVGSSLDSFFAELGELEEVKKMTEEKTRTMPPITYVPGFVLEPDKAFAVLRDELEWERRGDAPRSEYYCNDVKKTYVYGRGRGVREYQPRPYSDAIMDIRHKLELFTQCKFEVCFLNRYHDQSDHLGWHADDSPEMDDARPIAVVSLGVEREIWFKRKPGVFLPGDRVQWSGNRGESYEFGMYLGRGDDMEAADGLVYRLSAIQREEDGSVDNFQPGTFSLVEDPVTCLKLENGSLCLMSAGMQDEWFHRIPKASFQCGERISLTFRGYVDVP